MSAHDTRFDRAYLGHERPAEAARPAGAAPRELVVRAAPAEAVALHGCVLTPDGALPDGYVVVSGGQIAEVSSGRPDGVRVHETGGVILPGLIDLHGHPEFNVFAPWEAPAQFTNRYQWRASAPYHTLIRDPQNTLLSKLPAHTQLRYAEIRALVGGVTAIQGSSGTDRRGDEALVRNVDLRIFGRRRARAMIDLPSGTGESQATTQLRAILAAITAHTVDAFYLHLAEGQPDDPRSLREFDHMVALGALTPATIVIHGTALTRDQLDAIGQQGRGLVWSPQSNLRLYGRTTDVATALDLGVPVALGADWLPTGSTSLLAELKVARHELARQGREVAPRDLVHMVTAGAAAIAGLADRLGTLAPGRPADILVLERHVDDPYRNVCLADPSWVDLVLIGGDLTYGRADWIRSLAADPGSPSLQPVTAWGKPMLLDTSFQAVPGLPGVPGDQAGPVTLAQLRTALTGAYPQVGPIFA
jgi:5-methylthioadenosine/S-adenosylhomocysteine deaminase